jgi:hypothetical protein
MTLGKMAVSMTTFRITIIRYNTKCLCRVSFMLCVANKSAVLGVVMLSFAYAAWRGVLIGSVLLVNFTYNLKSQYLQVIYQSISRYKGFGSCYPEAIYSSLERSSYYFDRGPFEVSKTWGKYSVLYLDFIQFWCISLTLAFTFDAFKVNCEISVSFGLVQNLEISDLAMAKVENVNIADTYPRAHPRAPTLGLV